MKFLSAKSAGKNPMVIHCTSVDVDILVCVFPTELTETPQTKKNIAVRPLRTIVLIFNHYLRR